MYIKKNNATVATITTVIAKINKRAGSGASADTGSVTALSTIIAVAALLAMPMLLLGCPEETPAPPIDTDGDGVLDSDDIDDDNDGLIDISSLLELHNMRHNLAGTSYKTSAKGTAITTGAPTPTTATVNNCAAATDGVYLCGYELVADLDFDADGDGRTWNATNYILDAGDVNTTYFPVAFVNSSGWLPIGRVDDRFVAIFEGNGNTIANLAMRRENQPYGGLFAFTGPEAQIRNIELASVLIAIRHLEGTIAGSLVGVHSGTIIAGSALDVAIIDFDAPNPPRFANRGGLVGNQQGTIIASYATGNVDGSDAGGDSVGGLAGIQLGPIIASYATVAVNGGAGDRDQVGGLVGAMRNRIGTLIASYATGNVNGGADNGDQVGGLVGAQQGIIIASYATGNVDGGIGTGDSVGKVAGVKSAGVPPPQSSYGFGAVSGSETADVSPDLPSGVTAPANLTASNAVGCSDPIYFTQTACELTTKAAGVWNLATTSASSACAAPTGIEATPGVDYTAFATDTACEEATKTAGTWGPQWNTAAVNTMDAWDFGSASQAPALRYADYDGSSSVAIDYACEQFPATVPGSDAPLTCGTTLLPGQGR